MSKDKLSPSFYEAMRWIFWRLPAPLRSLLHGPRHALVRWFRGTHAHWRSSISGNDLTWEEFERTVLHTPRALQPFIFETNIDWHTTLFQRPQHMALALGRTGRPVIYKTSGDALRGYRRVAANVWLANDPGVDSIRGAWRCFYSTSLFNSVAALKAASHLGPVVYEYIDHIDASISGGRTITRQLQAVKDFACKGGADLVVTSAASLQDEVVQVRGDRGSVCVPNGVDVAHYTRGDGDTAPLPEAFRRFCLDHDRIVGYFGAIAPWLWYELIDEVVQRMPDTGFVFIGPDYAGCVPSLPRKPNVHYVGPVAYAALPAHAGLFDVCFIPFRRGDVARSTSPLKLFEYFALQKPVVVTSDLQECTAFPEVFSGSDAESLITAIEHAFSQKDDIAFRRRLRQLAEENDWSVRAQAYSQALDQVIGTTYPFLKDTSQ